MISRRKAREGRCLGVGLIEALEELAGGEVEVGEALRGVGNDEPEVRRANVANQTR